MARICETVPSYNWFSWIQFTNNVSVCINLPWETPQHPPFTLFSATTHFLLHYTYRLSCCIAHHHLIIREHHLSTNRNPTRIAIIQVTKSPFPYTQYKFWRWFCVLRNPVWIASKNEGFSKEGFMPELAIEESQNVKKDSSTSRIKFCLMFRTLFSTCKR